MNNLILKNLPIPIITNRLLIRPPAAFDGLNLNEAILESFDELSATMEWARKKPSKEESEIFCREAAANWILRKNSAPDLPLFIFDKITNNFLGATGYHHLRENIPSIEIGYWLRTTACGKGIITEAVFALANYAFNEFKVNRIEIRCDVLNKKSQKIPERLGFVLEATLKNDRINPQTKLLSDTLIYAICKIRDLKQN